MPLLRNVRKANSLRGRSMGAGIEAALLRYHWVNCSSTNLGLPQGL